MSKQYPGGIISKTPPTPSGPYADSTAPGVWTLEDQAYWQKLGQWPTQGNVNPNSFIENLFQSWLYTGTGAAQTITNGINFSANNGLVWSKARNIVQDFSLIDTVRGSGSVLYSDLSSGADTGVTTGITAFSTTGYSLGTGSFINQSSQPYVSWGFQKQAKFFDIVTFSGNGSSTQTINHNLGSVPGCMIVKGISGATNWPVYHRSMDASPQNYYMILDGTAAKSNAVANWGNTAPTSTQFTVGGNNNINGYTYVAYLFAHNAGGFGLTGTDNVISCGYAAGGTTVNLGYEPQWVLTKNPNSASNWLLVDNMRGMPADGGGSAKGLLPNTSDAESDWGGYVQPTSTGFYNGVNSIYIAIRRGPMKVPTSGTSVYNGIARTGTGATVNVTGVGFPPDLTIIGGRSNNPDSNNPNNFNDRLRGATKIVWSPSTGAEATFANGLTSFNMDGVSLGNDPQGNVNYSSWTYINWNFQRAPSFFDEVCYTGNSTASTAITHNLGVVPELIIVKSRSAARNWPVYIGSQGNNGNSYLNRIDAWAGGSDMFANTTPTASVFYVGNNLLTNNSGETYVAYLFATCPNVSKVGSYTGTGATQTINCGFGAGGSRFVLIKRTDSTGDWYVWDSARGMVSGTDPSLSLNSTAAEVNANSIYTISTGFQIVSTAAGINASGGTYIFLSIA